MDVWAASLATLASAGAADPASAPASIISVSPVIKNLLETARDSNPLRRTSSGLTLTPPNAKARASPTAN
eukprot:scaffold123289_cov28-Prasinocladus_malaysianus.AAC.1